VDDCIIVVVLVKSFHTAQWDIIIYPTIGCAQTLLQRCTKQTYCGRDPPVPGRDIFTL